MSFLRKEKLSRQDTLNAKPVKNQAVGEKRNEKGETILIIPTRKGGWVRILSRILYIPQERTICLDEIGAWVWQKCNGNINVSKMIEALAKEFKINPKEAEISLLSFLKKLAQKRLIGFLIGVAEE